jgi:peptidoglycan/xylan/chitin deacetylase (PgdA/CDA1 family)
MHPRKDWMFNQIADDRDHMGMRIPRQDSFYGRGYERPVYFVSGEPQQRGKFMNTTTGKTSTASKFSSAFALGAFVFWQKDTSYSKLLLSKSESALLFGTQKTGYTQTASVRSPYIYAEENWADDIELAYAALANSYSRMRSKNEDIIALRSSQAHQAAQIEPVTPWLGTDTANHYQWYPFINIGHYETAKLLHGEARETVIGFYREGIEKVWHKAQTNAFYRGVPFIWCSNNLTVAFTMQCMWYQELTGDRRYSQLEQANFDWLFGCNPWGTSMVTGVTGMGEDSPTEPHSIFTITEKFPIHGGLVDGPVYNSIFKSLIGIHLKNVDEYAPFQSDLAVYHDDYGDYSTNEPTMDGTASLIYLLAAKTSAAGKESKTFSHGAVIRGDSTKKNIALVFTADEYTEGGSFVRQILKGHKVKASFFLTGRAYRDEKFNPVIWQLKADDHYLGPHSDQHLLYCDWKKRDNLLVSIDSFRNDLLSNYEAMKSYGIASEDAVYLLPPYEWYNKDIADWASEMGSILINMTPGTRSNADYTTPEMENYMDCETIWQSIKDHEANTSSGLNGFILLLHLGTNPARTDKCYYRLPELLKFLKSKGYHFQTVEDLLTNKSVLTQMSYRDTRY